MHRVKTAFSMHKAVGMTTGQALGREIRPEGKFATYESHSTRQRCAWKVETLISSLNKQLMEKAPTDYRAMRQEKST